MALDVFGLVPHFLATGNQKKKEKLSFEFLGMGSTRMSH